MKLSKAIPSLFGFLVLFQFSILAQTDSWKHAYTDIEINFSGKDVTIGLAGGYKINRFAGIGLKFEKSIEADNLNILSLHFRGTTFIPTDRWGIYYSASLGQKFGDENVGHLELAGGVRYERTGLGIGISEYGLSFKISQLFGDLTRKGTLLKKMFAPTSKYKYHYFTKEESDEKPERRMATYFHLVFGFTKVMDDPTVMNYRYGFGGPSLNIGGGRQFNQYVGIGGSFHLGTSIGQGSPNFSFSAIGVNFNGYPGVFFYNATLGTISGYELFDDSRTFKKSKGVVPFFEIKGGVRFFRRCSLGLSYFGSPKIKGNFKEYEDPLDTKILIIDETRRTKFSGVQVFFGITI